LAFVKTEPVSRRTGGAKAPLSRQALVDVAMRVMRADGLAKVTMRRIAAELDTGPASLYVYVSGVAELHGLMVDELLAGLPLPSADGERDPSWRAATVDVLVQLTTLLYAEPSLALSVVSLRPSGPRYLALLDWLLQSLRRGGVPARNAAWGVDVLLQLAVATAAEQGLRDQAGAAAGDEPPLAEAIAAADPAARPGLAWARDELFSGEGVERLRWSFGTLLDGIAAAA
jgi:AcrR family transcriptional regulator